MCRWYPPPPPSPGGSKSSRARAQTFPSGGLRGPVVSPGQIGDLRALGGLLKRQHTVDSYRVTLRKAVISKGDLQGPWGFFSPPLLPPAKLCVETLSGSVCRLVCRRGFLGPQLSHQASGPWRQGSESKTICFKTQPATSMLCALCHLPQPRQPGV